MKVQAAVDKRPFDRMKLYKLGILQLFMYHFSSTLDAVMYGPDSGNADHQVPTPMHKSAMALLTIFRWTC
jgi:hypothetical protein